MNPVLKQAIVFLCLLLIVTVVKLPYDLLPDHLENFLIETVRSSGGAMAIKETKLGFPATVTLNEVGASLAIPTRPPLPIPFVAQKISASLSVLNLLMLRLNSSVLIDAYQGNVSASISKPLFGAISNFNWSAKNLEIGEHPVAAAQGITGAVSFDGSLKSDLPALNPASVKEGVLNFSLTNGNYSGGHKISIVVLPPISNISTSCSIRLNETNLVVSNCNLTSSITSATVQGSVTRSKADTKSFNGPFSGGSLTVNLQLSSEGAKSNSLGGYLALAAKLDPQKSESIRKYIIKIIPKNGKWVVSEIRADGA